MNPIHRSTPSFLILLLFLLPSSVTALPYQAQPPRCSSADHFIVFSRRVYKMQGPSYQQIWTWKPRDGSLACLTHSPRNHFRPIWAGSQITFVSPDERDPDSKLWGFNPATGEERPLGAAPTDAPERQQSQGICEISATRRMRT